jgi:flagella basal body P-ring formation protein FlgA
MKAPIGFRVLFVAALALAASLAAVPVRAAQIEWLPVAAITIYPGDIITETMLTDGKFPEGTGLNRPVAVSSDEVVGKVARRTLLPGRLIPRNTVAIPDLVARGTIVPAIYQDGPLLITASVMTLQAGALGAMIQVRNIESGKVIVGLVQADGSVRVGGR